MWPLSVRISWPVVASQILTVWSSLAEATRSPSGLNATLLMSPVCPFRVQISRPVVVSQIFNLAQASRGQAIAIRAEGDAVDMVGVGECELHLASGRIPDECFAADKFARWAHVLGKACGQELPSGLKATLVIAGRLRSRVGTTGARIS